MTDTRLLVVASSVLLLTCAACSGGSSTPAPTPTDDTAGEITAEMLALMVLPQDQLGPEYEEFEPVDDNGPQTVEMSIEGSCDLAAERADLELFGWQAEHDAYYVDAEANEDSSGVIVVGSQVELLATSDGASQEFADGQADIQADVGKLCDDVTLNRVTNIDVDVADEAAGLRFQATALLEDEDPADDVPPETFDFDGLIVGFRHGRLIGSVSAAWSDLGEGAEENLEARLKDHARKLNDRIIAVLNGQLLPE